MGYPDGLIMRLLVSSTSFLKEYLTEESRSTKRALLKKKILKIARNNDIKQVIRTDYYMSLFTKITDKALRQLGEGFKPTRSEILAQNNIRLISEIAQKMVRSQFIDELTQTRRILRHQQRLGRLKSPRKKRLILEDPLAKGSSPSAHMRVKNKENENKNMDKRVQLKMFKTKEFGDSIQLGKKMKRGASCVEKMRSYASESKIGQMLKRQPFSLNLEGNLRIRDKIKRVLQTTFGSGKNGFLKLDMTKGNSKKKKPLFLNQEIAKRFSKTSEMNQRVEQKGPNAKEDETRNRSLRIRSRKKIQAKVDTRKPKSQQKPKSKKNGKRRTGHFPKNFIDWKMELKQNQKIQKSFERLFKRGKLRGQVKLNRKKSEKKRKIHFYMLKKNNLVGENFVISSVEQNFLLKHIVLFSIVKNNLFYRLTKINFSYSEKDVNMKGKLTRFPRKFATFLLLSRRRTRGDEIPRFKGRTRQCEMCRRKHARAHVV